ncbi:MAG: hypothetical protein ACLFQB_15970 [Chitinispirillaceae bacterium]
MREKALRVTAKISDMVLARKIVISGIYLMRFVANSLYIKMIRGEGICRILHDFEWYDWYAAIVVVF